MRTGDGAAARAAVRTLLSFHPVDRILGNLADFAVAGRTVERVPIAADDAGRRVLRLETSAGDLGLRLDGAAPLRNGDVLFADERCVIAIEILPDDVLVVRPRTRGEALVVAHALGNRHVPLIAEGESAIVRYAPALEALVRELDVPYERTRR
jgi:urease accessory protein